MKKQKYNGFQYLAQCHSIRLIIEMAQECRLSWFYSWESHHTILFHSFFYPFTQPAGTYILVLTIQSLCQELNQSHRICYFLRSSLKEFEILQFYRNKDILYNLRLFQWMYIFHQYVDILKPHLEITLKEKILLPNRQMRSSGSLLSVLTDSLLMLVLINVVI